MIYVFLGNEINILKEKINDLINKLDIKNIIRYDYDDTEIVDILNEINYIDLFNEKKLIIVNNFTFKGLKDKEETLLLNYIENMNDNALVLKCKDDILDNRKHIIKVLKEKCKVIEIKTMDYKELHEYVTKLFKDNNINVTYKQVQTILNLTDNNVDITLNEVNKILLYLGEDKNLTDEVINKVVSVNSEREMFKLSNAVMERNTGSMFDSYKIILSSGVDAIVIMDFLAKQFRTLCQVKNLIKNSNEVEISRRLGVNPYIVKKMVGYSNNFKNEEIINILFNLSNIDIDVKVNGLDKNKLLEIFFMNV